MKAIILFSVSLFLLISSNSQTTYPKDFVETPELSWTFKTDKPIYSSPIIDNNLVFFGSLDKNVYALNLSNGKEVWKFETGGEIRSTPAITEDRLYIVSGDGNFYAINKNTGKLAWKFKTEGEKTYELYSFADYYQSSPIVDNGIVYFGSGDSHAYALYANNGTLKWKFKTGSIVHSRPAIKDSQLFVSSFDGNVYALNKFNGTQNWKFKSVGQHFFPVGEMQGNPLVFANRVYIGSRDFNFYALNARKGYGHWNRQFPKGWAMGNPVVRDSVLYVGTSDDMVLLAMDPFTGNTKWKAEVKFNVFGGPAFTQSMVYIGSLMGKLFGIDLKTGTIKWVVTTELYKSNKSKYFTPDDAYRDDIQNIIKKSDDFLAMYYDLGAFFSTPALSGNLLVIASTDGNVYCYKNKN